MIFRPTSTGSGTDSSASRNCGEPNQLPKSKTKKRTNASPTAGIGPVVPGASPPDAATATMKMPQIRATASAAIAADPRSAANATSTPTIAAYAAERVMAPIMSSMSSLLGGSGHDLAMQWMYIHTNGNQELQGGGGRTVDGRLPGRREPCRRPVQPQLGRDRQV